MKPEKYPGLDFIISDLEELEYVSQFICYESLNLDSEKLKKDLKKLIKKLKKGKIHSVFTDEYIKHYDDE